MKDRTISHLTLADFGSIDLSIPVITYGSGRPILSLLTGVHGNETAGLFVIEQLVRALPDFAGQLRIIPSANPVAQALDLRVSPRDPMDLNRIFPGNADGQLPERIAFQLMKLLSDSDCVIDFHSFDLRNPVVAIFSNSGDEAVRRRSFQCIEAFAPVMIWQLNPERSAGVAYRGALAPALHERDVANFAVEMPHHGRMTQEILDASVDGVRSVMGVLGMTETKLAPPAAPIPIFGREEFFSPHSGLFFPTQDIMTEVRADQVLGRLTSITRFEDMEIRAPFDGTLLQIHGRAFVITGTSIYAMGHLIDV